MRLDMKYRVIKTNIDNSKVNNEILNSVIGQMSDGMWENSSRLQGFWKFAEISNDNDILIEDRYYYIHGDSCTKNPYMNMSDKEIRKFFAKKIKQIVREELKDNYEEEIRKEFYKIYNLPDEWTYTYPVAKAKEVNECWDAIKKYLEEHPFKFRRKFKSGDKTELIYLNYNETVTVDDAYKAYQLLIA